MQHPNNTPITGVAAQTEDAAQTGVNGAHQPYALRCTPVTRRRHMVVRHASGPVRSTAPALRVVTETPVATPIVRPADRPSQVGRRPIDRLTRRQLEVLSLMAEGHSNAAIARICYISEKAVVQHTSQIYDRLDLPNEANLHRRVHAVVIFLGQAA